MSEPPVIDLNALWKYTREQVTHKIALPALYRSMEAAKPVALDGDVFVLGYDAGAMHQAGLVADHRNKNVIEQVLEAATRKRLRVLIIPGTEPEDYDLYRQQQAEGARLQAEAREKYRQEVERGGTWDAIAEQLSRKFSGMENRGLPNVQGAYLDQALDILAEAYDRLMPDAPSELEQRSYCRALDRVQERAQVPSSLIAFLVIQRRRTS